MYKCSGVVEPVTTWNKSSRWLELEITGFQIRRPNHGFHLKIEVLLTYMLIPAIFGSQKGLDSRLEGHNFISQFGYLLLLTCDHLLRMASIVFNVAIF